MENRIKERREALNMTQHDLAEKSETARTIISQLETGSREVITTKTMLKIAKALECDIKDIFFS